MQLGNKKRPVPSGTGRLIFKAIFALEAQRQGDAMILAEEILCLGDISVVK